MASVPSPATNEAQHDMQPRIQIVGAGFAGLSLASHLRLKRIPFQIFDSASGPQGHNYGITIKSEAYEALLPALDPKLDHASFAAAVAVDRSVGGKGFVSSSDQQESSSTSQQIRVSDTALRKLLAQNHHIQWNHRVTRVHTKDGQTTLEFDNRKTNTAPITIDAGGDRHGLRTLLHPDLDPEILPYATHHGSRYVPLVDFKRDYHDLFAADENVHELTIPLPQTTPDQPPRASYYIQLQRSYVTKSGLPRSLRDRFSTTGDSTPILELRYTVSRPSLSSSSSTTAKDALFNPSRAAKEATTIPDALYTELDGLVSSFPASSSPSTKSSIPSTLPNLLSPTTIKANQDRILNWLLRVKPTSSILTSLADNGILCIGDAAHGLPIVGSQGASLAFEDARVLAGWLETSGESEVARFYEESGVTKTWDEARESSKEWLRGVHGVADEAEVGSRL